MDRSGRREAAGNLARVRGSETADWVATVRALHFATGHRPLVVEDPYAGRLISRRSRRIMSSKLLLWLFQRVLLRKLMPSLAFLLSRARFSDDRVVAAAGRGVRQVVILGAGLDTFALRFPDLGVEVFEVDLPASAALKKERLAAANLPVPDHLRFVSVDFERDDLAERLAAAGFRSDEPAFFSWMGVTYYLAREAVLDTVATVSALAVPGSELTLDYLIVRECVPPEHQGLFDANADLVRRFGEPMRSSFRPEAVVEEVGLGEGWELLEHDFPAANPARYLGDRTDLFGMSPLFRLLHLRRR